MKRILLLGAGGTLGTAICHHPGLTGGDFSLIPLRHDALDIEDATAVRTCMEQHAPDYVVNAAAYTNVDAAQLHPDKAYALNATCLNGLVAACRATQAGLIHISTDYVFDGYLSRPYTETDCTHPLNTYGASKQAGEQLVLAYERGLVVRTSWLYSAYPGARNFLSAVPRLLLQRAQENQPLVVEAVQQNAPTYAPHLVEMLLALMRQAVPHGLFHGCNTGGCTRLQFAQKVRELLLGRGLCVAPVQPLAQEPRAAAARPATQPQAATMLEGAPRPTYSIMSNKLLARTLGVPIPTWEAGAAQFVDDCDRLQGLRLLTQTL